MTLRADEVSQPAKTTKTSLLNQLYPVPSVTDKSPEFNPQRDWPSSPRHETGRGWTNCYSVRNAQSPEPPDSAGITVLPELGTCWVRVWLRNGLHLHKSNLLEEPR
jgi:hypothetical protein